MLKNIPNIITSLRIVGTGCLLFFKPLSVWFYIAYAFTGLTDVLDGYIARKTKTTSELGAKLDSIADLLFYAVMLLKVFPMLWELLPTGLWITVAAVLAVRLCAYITAFAKYHRFASLHTYMNKLTGAAVFLVPFLLLTPIPLPLCWCVCGIAVLSSMEELLIHIFRTEYHSNAKTLFEIFKKSREQQ
ncbi:MAG: CDP-alcohol phosphatidyltransferase family protein [Clostridia bacterium]|nr:CDP-alcohol phosphatidyltransferase family protein [Clostridia bacterium]